MTFTQAIIEIYKRKDMELCGDENELVGKLPICVYRDGQFIGKLRWFIGQPASVDQELVEVLEKI